MVYDLFSKVYNETNYQILNYILKLFLITSILICFIVSGLRAQSAYEIVKLADEKMRGETSQSTMIIRTIRPKWSREMTLKTWTKGTSYAVLLIQSPAKDKGTCFLKKEKGSMELDSLTGEEYKAPSFYDESILDGNRFYQ